ncbi:MAG: lysophospholipid acyltransferase family protein [Bdellovibrio sp.]|nr:lysophospholipid acyltransferase family protein [Bdellovibrio sp.]
MESKTLGFLIIISLKISAWIYYYLPRILQKFCIKAVSLLFRLCRFRQQVIIDNLKRAFPGDSETIKQRRQALFQAAYWHWASLVFEVLMVFGPMPRFIKKNVKILGLENYKKALSKNKGVFLLSSHVGNWEIMSGCAKNYDLNLMIVTKKLKPAWFHNALEEKRKHLGVLCAYEPKTLKDVFRHLKSGGIVGFILDQYTGPPSNIRVPLFGIPVGTSAAFATLVKRTQAEVLPVVNYRNIDGKFIIDLQSPLHWIEHQDLDHEIALNTAHYVSILEKHILAHPEQWLWMHKRFKGDLSPLKKRT